MANNDRTLYCGNLSERVTEDILFELFLQAGPLENVTIPKEKDGRPRKYAFITFKHADSVPYTVALMNGISLYGKPLKLDARTGAQSERNPYLDKLMQYRNPSAPQNVNYNQREMYEDNSRRFDSRRYESRVDYNSWNAYPPPLPPVPYAPLPPIYSSHAQDQMRFIPSSGSVSPSMVSYPYANRQPWSRSHR